LESGFKWKEERMARRSGVIGTFGIWTMANFGRLHELRVETRAVGSNVTLISSQRDPAVFLTRVHLIWSGSMMTETRHDAQCGA